MQYHIKPIYPNPYLKSILAIHHLIRLLWKIDLSHDLNFAPVSIIADQTVFHLLTNLCLISNLILTNAILVVLEQFHLSPIVIKQYLLLEKGYHHPAAVIEFVVLFPNPQIPNSIPLVHFTIISIFSPLPLYFLYPQSNLSLLQVN